MLEKGGTNSFSLGPKQHKPPKNTTALGQQTALPRAKQPKQKGQPKAVSKLRTQRFTEKIQLALLDPADPRSILDEQASKDLSLRILLTSSLMKKWQLITTRVRTALPQQQTKSQLRELGLRQSFVDSQIFVGDQLCVMLREHVMLIGGENLEQEDFLTKLSACMPLEDTRQLDEKTPLNLMGRSLEYHRAERSISLHLPSAFYLQLLKRYSLEDATARDSPRDELEQEVPRWTNIILDAERTKLYRQTVGDLQWSSFSRPDISFAVQQLSNSFMKPTESHEHQLVNLLRYLKGTQHYSISLQPPRRWKKAKNLELLAFSSTSWPEACRSISGLSLSFMGAPLATSVTSQATTIAAELESVRMACTQAIHTKSLLQDLQLDQPIALRVLAGGPLAEQLGLSRKNRHLHLWSWFGQCELSKVGSQQNLAASLTKNIPASGLHRLLPKLRMHTRFADALALSTELGSGPAFFRSSSSSFFIGVLSKTPAMAQLTARELEAAYRKESLQKELEAAYCEETSFQHKELEAACPANRGWRAFTDFLLGQTKARELELSLAQLCKSHFAIKSLQQKELAAAYAFLAQSDSPTRARELELSLAQLRRPKSLAKKPLQQKELEAAYVSMAQCSTRASRTTAAGKL